MTVVPIALAFWWLMYWHKRTWRRYILERCGRDMRAIAQHLDGQLMVKGWGWCVRDSSGRVSVVWRAGLTEECTWVRYVGTGPGRHHKTPGLAPAAWVFAQLSDDVGAG